jgi:hypothetical protein
MEASHMRMYGGRFMKKAVDRRIRTTQETRDAVIWDVNLAQHYCRVKVQGSNELVIASIPQNYRHRPMWLKIGNSVRITHRGGSRGFMEVSGEGRAIPSPVAGDSTPGLGLDTDRVLIGMAMTPSTPDASWCVWIGSGSYMVNGVWIFYAGNWAWVMGEGLIRAGTGESMGFLFGIACADPAPSINYARYDAFAIGADGVIDYYKGAASRSEPTRPTIDADHVLLGDYILMIGGVDAIYQWMIGADYREREATTLRLTTTNPIPLGEHHHQMRLEVLDQYGTLITPPTAMNEGTAEVIDGSGLMWSARDGEAKKVGQNLTTSRYDFFYNRDFPVVEYVYSGYEMPEMYPNGGNNIYGEEELPPYMQTFSIIGSLGDYEE